MELNETWRIATWAATETIYTLGPDCLGLWGGMGASPRREVARFWTLLRISVRMVPQLLGSSIAHSSDSGNISLVPEVGTGNDPGMERAGVFRTLACPMFRSMILAIFEVLMRSPIFMDEPVRFVGCPDEVLGIGGLGARSRRFSICPEADYIEHHLRIPEGRGKRGLRFTSKLS